MKKLLIKLTKIVLAIVIGEFSLVVGTTIAQEVLFDGISYANSSTADLAIGGLATIIAAFIAGSLAALVVSGMNIIPTVISILIFAETTALVLLDKTSDPLWFDVLAGIALILAIWAGYLWTSSVSRK